MMKIKKQTLGKFLKELSSFAPTPGGGATAALAGALGAALVGKVGRLTKNQERLPKVVVDSDRLQKELLTLADQDCLAYQGVVASYRLPKSQKNRLAKIQKATVLAARVPLMTAQKSLEVLKLASLAISFGNQAAVSDARCAYDLAQAAIDGALENVRINLVFLKNTSLVKELKDEIKKITREMV